MLFSVIVISLFLISCAPEYSEQELQELDTELESLPDEELQAIAEGSEREALAGQAINKYIPYSKVRERAKLIYEAKPVCGDGVCDKSEDYISCLKDCECYDTDGGKNPEKFGVIKLESEGKSYITDFCISEKQVLEQYCLGKEEKSEILECSDNKICDNNECVNPDEKFICGNGICENQREKDFGCSYDCGWGSCKGNNCNEKVDVYCACKSDEFKAIKEGSPCQGEVSCDNCDKQTSLFSDFADIQSQVYDCLANYFGFKPNRVPNLVVYDSLGEECNDPNGCFGYETGKSYQLFGLYWNPLPGSRDYNENQPTKPNHLIADKHEITHHFISRALHFVPQWFNEAIAIQTNERLKCHPKESLKGDGYLAETNFDLENNGGIHMDDNTRLNDDFYLRLKKGQTSLSDQEKNDYYITGVLWVLGLKLDYGCKEDCISKIVLKLKEHIDEQCKISQEACGLGIKVIFETLGPKSCPQDKGGFESPTGNAIVNKIPESQITPLIVIGKQPNPEKHYWFFWDGISIDFNAILKQATDEVVGQDTAPLFKLLEIQY